MDTLSHRFAGADDVAPLHALVESGYRGDSARRGWSHEADLLNDTRTTAAELAATIADPATRVVLLHQGDDLIGTVTVAGRGDARAYMGMLCVDPARQAHGLGRTLIALAEQIARDEFAARVIEMTVIDQRRELIAYYQRRGYRLTGETRPFPPAGDRPMVLVVLDKPL